MPQRKKSSTLKTRKPRKSPKSKNEFWHKKMIVTDVPIWNCQVVYAVNMSEKEVMDSTLHLINTKPDSDRHEAREREFLTGLVQELEGWDNSPTALGRMCCCGFSYVVLLRLDRNKFRKAVGTLIHEITHVVQCLLRHRRTPLNEDTEEVQAYLTQYLVEEALYALYD